MSFVYSDFVAAFPEFGNATTYPQATFNFWQSIANLRLNVSQWGPLLDHGAMLFIAHNMKEQGRNLQQAGAGTGLNVGDVRAPVSAKSIDKISYAFNTEATAVEGAGDYNASTYGVQFFQLALLIGAGGAQL